MPFDVGAEAVIDRLLVPARLAGPVQEEDDRHQDRRRPKREDEVSSEELYEQIGRLKMEVDWLKKKSTELT